MRRVTMVRLGVAAALATMGVVGAIGSGCSNSTTVTTTDGGGQTAGGDSSTGGGSDGSTGSTDGATGTGDGGIKDSGPGHDSALPTPANVIVANTAPGVPPFRLCLATGTGTTLSVSPVQALPDGVTGAPPYPKTGTYPAVAQGTPGIYPGTIGAFPTVTDLSQITLTPFLVLASSIAGDVGFSDGGGTSADGGPEETCNQLIGTHGLGTAETAAGAIKGRLTLGTDFFPLPSVPSGTLLDRKTYLLTVNGCLPGATPGTAEGIPATFTCGAGYDGGNSVSIGVVELDTTTPVADGGIGVQFAHRSTALENTPIQACANPPTCNQFVLVHNPATAGVWPAIIQPGVVGSIPNDAGDDAGDGGDAGSTPQIGPVPTNLSTAPITYSGGGLTTPLQSVTLSTTDPTQLAFGVFTQPLDGGAPSIAKWPGTPSAPGDLIPFPFFVINELSAWNASTASAPTGFQVGQAYTFILVGDPVAAQLPNPDGGPGINPSWDGRGIHILAFPNVFSSKSL